MSDRTSDVSTAFALRGLRPTERPQRVAPAMRGVLFEEQVRLWMSGYFPIVRYCNKEKFEHNECF